MVDTIDYSSLRLLRHPVLCLRLWHSQQLGKDREPLCHCLCDIPGERTDSSHVALCDDSQLHEILSVHLFDLFVLLVANYDRVRAVRNFLSRDTRQTYVAHTWRPILPLV